MARFNDIARELQALLNQPGWTPDDKTQLVTRLANLLTTLTSPSQTTYPGTSDDPSTTTSTPPPKASSSRSLTKSSAPNILLTSWEDALQPTDVAIIGLACRFPAAANPATSGV